jgi:cytoskeletal protein CcmA (bactofilin family)
VNPVANIDVTIDTLGSLISRTNILLNSLSTEIITANATYANTGNTATPRNTQLYGTFSANTVSATNVLRGGNVSSSGNLNITSNTIITGGTFTSSANSTYSNNQYYTADINMTGANVTISGTNLISTSNLAVTSYSQSFKANSTISFASFTANSTYANTYLGGSKVTLAANSSVIGTFSVSSDTSIVGALSVTNTAALGNTTITGFVNVSSTGSFTGNVSTGGNMSAVGALSVTNTAALGNTTITGFVNVSSSANVAGNIRIGGTANIVGSVNVTNTMAVGNVSVAGTLGTTGTASLGGNTTITGELDVSGKTTIMTDYVVEVSSNTNIGSNAATRVIYSFPKATYRSGKIVVFANNTGVNQISEMNVIHDGTTSYSTVYGTVAAPYDANNESPLGTLTSQINTANVEILLTQTLSNTAVKVVANLIK